ncbi:MAG TPA: agmatine deiminase family protein [Pseudobacteroides sp.]|uniref:agmatine deiminase family protein n=1 Tax=Pseudobacteroides sp. TaxID=1968840 RepID=UPI002F93C56E
MKRISTILIIIPICLLFLLAGVWKYQPQKRNNNIKKLEYNSGNTPASYRLPGEFEKQQAIWLQWPSEAYNVGNHPVSPVIINVIKAIDPFIRVNVMTRSKDEISQIKALLKSSGYTGTSVSFYDINHMSIWTRDVGPVFVMNANNKLNVVDFGFNNYSRDGSQDYINVEGQVDRLVAQRFNLPVIATSLISEGGAIESNGKGTLMTTESVVLKRNPDMTKQQIENEYKRVFGLKKIIWLKKGLAEDDRITSGHINEIARFASPNTILLAQVLPGDRYANNYTNESYLRLEENYNILKNSTDQDGKPFRIIRIPMPPMVYGKPNEEGKTPIRSYLNYAATNGAVLFQSYWKSGLSTELRDTENGVIDIFRGVFPGRQIIGIDSENVNLWGGGLHCITQHMPAE